MEARLIESFIVVAEELHFGRAAVRLHLTQPSLSQQIKKLERDVGVELLFRNARTVRLTSAGEAFLAEVANLREDMRRAAATAEAAASGRSGKVTLAFNERAGQLLVPGLLSLMQSRYPRVVTTLEAARTGPQLEGLTRGSLDVGVLHGPTHDARLVFKALLPLSVGVLVGARHAWGRRSSVAVSELATVPCVMFDRRRSPAMYDAIMAASDQAGTKPNVVEYMDDSALTQILVAGRSLAAFASYTGREDVRPMGLKVIPLVDPVPTLELQAAWSPENVNNAIPSLVECIELAAQGVIAGATGTRGTERVSPRPPGRQTVPDAQ